MTTIGKFLSDRAEDERQANQAYGRILARRRAHLLDHLEAKVWWSQLA